MTTTYEISGLTVNAIDKHGERDDLNARGEPCTTADDLRQLVRELYRAGSFEFGIDGDHVGVSRRAAEIRDELLAQVPADARRCECGEWSGERCEVVGQAAEMIMIEWMPEHLRASHVAAGNRGRFPANGASRIRVSRACADRMLAQDGEWCEEVA